MANPSRESLPEKACVACGRRMVWRKKWARDWSSVKYCSEACRRKGVGEVDLKLERALLDLLARRAVGATVCPSEAARLVDSAGWRELMEDARRAARRLVDRGLVDITQRGRVVDPSDAKGPIRVRLRQ